MCLNIYENIVREYYSEIKTYCKAKLNGNMQAAEDCTQEVFLALFRKMDKLKLSDNIRAWLYEAARLEVLKYIHKNGEPVLSLEQLPDIPSDEILEEKESVFDILSDKEMKLIKSYYLDCDKTELANENNLTMNGLYLKIHRIRKKISDKLNKNK